MSVKLGRYKYIATQGPCPEGFHVPTKDEWVALCGVLTTTFGLARNATTMVTYLKMPIAGNRAYNNANVANVGTNGRYWSSTPYDANKAYHLTFHSANIYPQNYNSRSFGFSVRPFYNEGIVPNGGWQVLYQGSGSAGIYWHKDLGLITASGDGVTWVTIADKNLGATTVYNQGDTLSEENCGGYFQWGNNHMFPFTGTVTTSSTQVNASSYGPGNWYDSSTFITNGNGWDSSYNANLWGGVDGNVWKDVESICRLPSEYQAVEWVGMSGDMNSGSHINTNLFPYNNYQVETKIETLSTETERCIFGGFVNGSSSTTYTYNYYNLINYLNQFYWGINNSDGHGGSFPSTAGVQYEITYNNSSNRVIVNGSDIGDCTGTVGFPGSELCINVRGKSGQYYWGKYKYFYFKVYDKTTGKYIRDYIPCYRKSDGVIGMYDTVNEAFYTNAGTGTFTKGNDTSSGMDSGEHQLDEHTIIYPADYSAMQGPAPSGFHVPSKDEWGALCGILTTTFSMADSATTMGTYLKMPMAGYRSYTNANVSLGAGYYWSYTPRSTKYAYHLYFASGSIHSQDLYDPRANGYSIRCFKDTPVVPTSSWTTLYQGTGGAGVFWNNTDGLISISGDGFDWITIQDKNLGATTVYNQGDSLTANNCGNFYQWGNNYGFPRPSSMTPDITKSSTQVDASNYGPGNYYSRSTFIMSNNDWSSVQNDNLWGATTGIVIPTSNYYSFNLLNEYIGEYHECNVNTMGPCPDGFHVPTKDDWVKLCGILTSTFGMAANSTTMSTYLKMPMAGFRSHSSAGVISQGTDGGYWSSSRYNANSAYYLNFYSTALYPQINSNCTNGYSIRPFKNFPVIPDSSWTTLYDGSSVADFAGIFHNTADGLISISGDGTNWITIADKNLGASTVYNSGDTLSESNCGLYYQWGNNHGFPFTGTVTTSSTQVDASTYGPFTEYYNSDTFITRSSSPYDWSSVRNDNLWGGVSGNTRNCSLGGGGGFPTTVVCDFRAGAPGELTTLAQVKNPGDFIAQRGSSEIVDGADGSVRIRISSTDYFAQVCLGGCGFYNSTITNLGYSNGIPDRASGKQNLIKKAYIRIKSSYGSSSGYSTYSANGVVMYFANKQVSSNVYGRDDVCCAGFPFSRGSDSGNYIWGPLDSNVQFLALPSTANVGAGVRCTTYINQGVSCADSRVTLETRGTGPSDFHYWLIVEKTGNEYDLGLCSNLGWAQVIVTCGDWWHAGSYRDIDEIYMEVFDNWYIDADGNITDTKPW